MQIQMADRGDSLRLTKTEIWTIPCDVIRHVVTSHLCDVITLSHTHEYLLLPHT